MGKWEGEGEGGGEDTGTGGKVRSPTFFQLMLYINRLLLIWDSSSSSPHPPLHPQICCLHLSKAVLNYFLNL